MDCNPAIRMTRFTTMASTGLLTNRSVNFIGSLRVDSAVLRPRLALRGLGSRTIRRLYLVIDLDCCAIAQLEHTRCNHLIPGIDAGDDSHLVATRGPYFYELLPHTAIRLSLFVFHVADDVYGVAVGSVTDRRSRQLDQRAGCPQVQIDLNEHAGMQLVLSVGQGGLHLYVTSVFVND